MMANTKRRVLSLLMALVMTLGLLPISALAEGLTYQVGDSFTAESAAADLPKNIAPNTYWGEPEKSNVYSDTYTCGHEENEVIWADPTVEANWEQISQEDYLENDEHYHCQPGSVTKYYYNDSEEYTGDRFTRVKTGEGIFGRPIYRYDRDMENGNYGNISADRFPSYVKLTKKVEDTTTYSRLTSKIHHHTDVDCKDLIGESYVWTLQQCVVNSVTIVNDVANSGCLVANVDGHASGYQWQIKEGRNFKDLAGETGKTLQVAKKDLANETLPIYRVVVSDGTHTKTSEAFKLPYYTALQNGSFETPRINDIWRGFEQIPSGTRNMIWKTTAEDQRVEFVYAAEDNHNFPDKAAAGLQFAELNAERFGALYQDVMTEPGTVLHWGFAHSGRGGATDTMQLIIGETGSYADNWNPARTIVSEADGAQGTFKTPGNTWTYREGTYLVPTGQYLTRFYFNSVDAVGSSDGNLLDAITFSTTRPAPPPTMVSYTFIYTVDGVESQREPGSIADKGDAYPSHLGEYANYKAAADYSGAKMTVTKGGNNEMTFAFTTPEYAVEYYTKGSAVGAVDTKITDTALLATLTTSGNATYGTAVSFDAPDSLTYNGAIYTLREVSSLTMSKTGENVIKVYYDFTRPVQYTVNYAWTSASEELDNVTLPSSTTDVTAWDSYDPTTLLPELTSAQTKAGYSISGWFKDAAGQDRYTPNTELTDGATLYAKLEYNEPSLSYVKYAWAKGTQNPAGAALPTDQIDKTLTELRKIQLTNLTTELEGYSFQWYTDYEGNTPATQATLTNLAESITLYARFTYQAPKHPYTVKYELYFAANDGGYQHKETVVAVAPTMVTEASCPNVDTYLDASYTKDSVTYTVGSADTDRVLTGSWQTSTQQNPMVFTIKLYGRQYTTGSLKITKNITGDLSTADLAALKSGLTFTVTGEDYENTIPYDETFKTGHIIKGLKPGNYTVTESDPEMSGYTWTGIKSDSADVTIGAEPKAINLSNHYVGKSYEITFKAGAHGTLSEGRPGTDAQTVYTWTPVQDSTPVWAVEGSNDRTIVYKFTYAQYEKGGMYLPDQSVNCEAGYAWAGGFTGRDSSAYVSFTDTMTKLLASGANAITYRAADCTANLETPYTVEYRYQTADGSYTSEESAYLKSETRTGVTGGPAALTEADRDVNPLMGLSGVTYALDGTSNDTTIAGDGSTVLTVKFKWQKGVSYAYEATNGVLPVAISTTDGAYAVTDTNLYIKSMTAVNQGAIQHPATTTTYPVAGGVWHLTSWMGTPADGVMTNGQTGVTYTGKWTYVDNASAMVTVRFVDENNRELLDTVTANGPFGSHFDVSSATEQETITVNGYTYDFSNIDYVGPFAADHVDEDVAYTGAIPSAGQTINRVYSVRKAVVIIDKTYNIATLPVNFTITATDTIDGTTTTVALADAHITSGKAMWNVQLPVGRTYTFAENGYYNGEGWHTTLTAKQALPNEDVPMLRAFLEGQGYNWLPLTVTDLKFDAVISDATRVTSDHICMISLDNNYYYVGPGGDGDDDPTPPVVIPDDPTPTTDLPETEVPTTDLPETEIPMAEAPATGDNLALWILAAAVSGLSLVWLTLSGKKRKEENAE